MLTSRGLSFLLTIIGLLALALFRRWVHVGLMYLGITLLAWFAVSWLLFAVKARLVARKLSLARRIQGESGPVSTLWSRGSFEVYVGLRLPSKLALPYVVARDRVPFGISVEEGETSAEGTVGGGEAIAFSYRIRDPAPGKLRFEGVNVQISDLQGFFYHAAFVADPVSFRVLPPLADARGRTAIAKRHNLLPPPGIHRLRRPGSGTDLLDLRDYLPGDPPKTIAWKLSARRDRLITKEFESEVPVRCTLLVDRSNSVRLGAPPTRPVVQLIEIAAIIAQAAAGSRDLVGLCMFDESSATTIRPGRGGRHLAHLLNTLTDAASLPPTTDLAGEEKLLPLAHAFAQEVYPELMRPDVNRFPLWLAWLSPRAPYGPRRPRSGQRWFAWLPLLLLAYAVIGLPILLFLVVSGLVNIQQMGMPPTVAFAVFGVAFLALVSTFVMVPRQWFFPEQRRQFRWRKQMAAVLSTLYGPVPGGLAALLEDEPQFARALQRFLADHQVPFSPPLYDERGRYLFAAPAKVEVLTRSLLRAVKGGHDNELFVILADLLELGDRLEPLLDAVKVAMARHHRVIVVCPWPAGVAPPADNDGATTPAAQTHRSTSRQALRASLQEADTQRLHREFFQLRRRFGRLGVPLISARSSEPARLILERLERLRAVGRYR
jgi:uncharacterized protein (DUF58 family)